MATSTLRKQPAPASKSAFAAILRPRFALNYICTLLFIGLSYWIITDLSMFHKGMLHGSWNLSLIGIEHTITINALMIGLAAFYAVILIPYYVANPSMHSSAFVFLRGIIMGIGRKKESRMNYNHVHPGLVAGPLPIRPWISPMTKQAGLALLLKFFFAPLMINWCLAHIGDMFNSISQVIAAVHEGQSGRTLFDNGLFWTCFQLILFIDTLLFTLGYIIEAPSLNNRIRTVEPTFLGWFVCLACYPPFNSFTGQFIPWQSNDFPQFQSDTMHFIANITVLVAMAIFSWASVALGFKASNLTNRGIVTHGPYAYVRHPAYAAKNFAWWLGALPTLYLAFNSGLGDGLYAVFGVAGWTFMYFMRAITEERHLLIAKNGYAEYMQKVKYRFVPGII
jgi:hypothetical protein